ncbi:MAG: hypothetical protein IJ716_14595 [Lachnospiraceae bacterium]|nr:hypothetical protein [Lachnospiraceae bacterium]
MNLLELYNTNPDFKTYVDRYSKTYKLSVAEALTHKLVREVAEYYTGKTDNKPLEYSGDILKSSEFEEDKSC